MPNPSDYKDKKSFMAACPNIVLNEGTAKDIDQAVAICHSMWEQHHKKESEHKFEFECKYEIKEFQETEDWIKFKATAVIGDRIMNGVFVPYEELKKSINGWNGTIHDINHMATSYPDNTYPYKRQNLEYVIGFQNNPNANDNTKEITVDINIYKHSPKYNAWKSFIDINSQMGKIPNVSMSINAKPKAIKVVNLKSNNASYETAKLQGYDDGDVIGYLEQIQPVALTTCIKGDCDDTKGCGITMKYEDTETKPKNDCGCASCNSQTNENSDENKKSADYLAYLTKRVKEIKGDNK